MMKRFLFLPIRTHLMVLVCLLAVPMLVIVVYSGWTERDKAIKDAQDNCVRFVNTLAARQQSAVIGAEQLTLALAMLPPIRSHHTDAATDILANLPRTDIQYSIIAVADKTGRVWAASIPFKHQVSIADRKYFQDVLRTGLFTAGESVVGKISPKPILTFGSPIRNRGNALSGVMSIGLVFDFAQDAFEKARLHEGSSSFSMLDRRGIIICSHLQQEHPGRVRQGSRDLQEGIFTIMKQGPDEGTCKAVGNDGKVRLFAYRKLRLPHEREPYLYIRGSITQAAAVVEAITKMQKRLVMLVLIFILGYPLSGFSANGSSWTASWPWRLRRDNGRTARDR